MMRGDERMDDLPKLVKSYYTIEEVFNRLKRAGADLDKPEDVLLLARKGLIDVDLLCDRSITLISTELAQPSWMAFHTIKKRMIEEVKRAAHPEIFPQSTTNDLLKNIESSNYLLYVEDGRHKEGFEDTFITFDMNDYTETELIITPLIKPYFKYADMESELLGKDGVELEERL